MSGNSIKRKLSRKEVRKGVDHTEPHTSSRRQSRDSLGDIELHQPHEHKKRQSTKKDENQNADPLNKIEDDKMEQCSDDKGHFRNSSHRSSSGKAPHDSSNTNENRSSQHNKNPNAERSISEDMPTTSSIVKMVESDIKNEVGDPNSEMNPNFTQNIEIPTDSLNTDQSSEEIDHLKHQQRQNSEDHLASLDR